MPPHVLDAAVAPPAAPGFEMPVPVRITAGEQIISGELIVPASAVGVVICAGSRGDCVARNVRAGGNATLCLDLLTSAEEREDRATHGLHFNVPLLAERLVAATRWLAHQPFTANLGFGYFGEDIMGAAALVAAAELGFVVDAVVCRRSRPDFAANALPRVEAATLLICCKNDPAAVDINRQAFARLKCEKQLQVIPPPQPKGNEVPDKDCVGCSLAASWFHTYVRAR